MRVKTVLATLVLAWSVSGRAMAADSLAVLPVSGINVHSSYLEAAQDLLRQHLSFTGAFRAVLVSGQPPTSEWPPDKAVETGKAAGAKWVVATHITRLAARATVRIVLYDVGSGSAAYSDQTEAASPDDLNAVLLRLARSVAWRKPVGETGDIESVTEKEEEAYLKKQATNTLGLRLGALFPFNRPAGKGDAAIPGGGISWLYDMRTLFAEGSLDFYFDDDQGAVGPSLGVYYPFSRKDLAPYAGGGLTWWWSSDFSGQADPPGLAFYGAGGVIVGRLASVQIRPELRYFVNTFLERLETGARSRVHGLVLSLGIGF